MRFDQNLHFILGFKDPLEDCPHIPLVIRSFKRLQGERARKKPPITALVLFSIKLHLDFTLFDHVMFWAACCLAFFGFLRCSEFTVPVSSFHPYVNYIVQRCQLWRPIRLSDKTISYQLSVVVKWFDGSLNSLL